MKKIFLILIIIFMFFRIMDAQITGKTITLNSTDSSNVYIARDWIEMQAGFSFTPSEPTPIQNKIVELKWNYSGLGEVWRPYITLNSQTVYGSELPAVYNFYEFFVTIQILSNGEDLNPGLSGIFRAEDGWTFTVIPNSTLQYVILRIEHASNYILGSYKNYNDTLLVQGYAPATDGTFEAKIDHTLLFDASYHTPVDPDTRQINTSLPVGTVKGVADVSPSGAATYNIPIFVSSGTNGMQPQLAVAYNSQGGNGLLGIGWDIAGLSIISRVPQNYYNDGQKTAITLTSSDRFVLNGNRLICTSGSYGANNAEYRTELDEFAKVISYGNSGPQWFKVQTKDGVTMYFGNTADSRIEAPGSSTVMYWRLNKISDANGNYINYIYGEDNGESWISAIEYTGNSDAGFLPYNKVKFVYEKRLDESSGYTAGKLVSSTHLLIAIRVECDGRQVKEYKFKYSNDFYSHLNEVIEYGIDGTSFNSTIISYGNLTNQIETTTSFDNDQSNRFYFGDFNGDGRTDFIRIPKKDTYTNSDKWEVFINQDGVNFTKTDEHNLTNCPNCTVDIVEKRDFDLSTIDINGDGLEDFILVKYEYVGGILEYLEYNVCASQGTTFDIQGTNTYYHPDPIPRLSLGDFDGDGITEILHSFPGSLMYNYNSIPIDFNGEGKVELLALNAGELKIYDYNTASFIYTFTNVIYDKIFPGDFNGDGKTDLLTWKLGVWRLYFSTGISFVESDITFTPTFPMNPIPSYLNYFVNDFNGDGKSDILEIKRTGTTSSQYDVHYFTGIGFVKESNTINYTTYTGTDEAYGLGDFNGDGKMESFFKRSNPDPALIVRFHPNEKKHLVHSITNGFNQKTSFTYLPINTVGDFYTGGPSFEVNYPRGYKGSMHCVQYMTVPNGLEGNTTTSFKYKNAKIHLLGKGFLGFSEVTSSTAFTDATGIKTVNTFEYNPTYFNVSLKMSETYTIGGGLLRRLTNTNEVKVLDATTKRIFPYIRQSVNFDNLTNTTVTSVNTYNNDGNLTDNTTTYGNDVTTTMVNVYNSYGNWGISNKVTQSTETKKYDVQPTFSHVTSYSYDTRGNLTQTVTYQGLTKAVTQTFTYPVNYCGKPSSITLSASDINSRSSAFTYDSKFRFAATITNPLGHKVIYGYDEIFGMVISETDANNNTTWNSYDAFGRLISTTLPTGKTVNNSLVWITDNNPPRARYAVISSSAGSPENKTFYDALGRELQNRITGFEGSFVYTDKEYYSDGNLKRECSAYKSGDTKFWTTYTYDNYKRLDLVTTSTCSMDYSYSGKTVTVTDCKGRSSSKTINNAGDLVTAVDIGGTITYAYHSSGQLRQIAAAGAVTTMTYNEYGRQTSITDPDAGIISFTYNSIGELLNQTNARNQTTSMTYDLLGRIKTKTYPDPDGSVTYNYDNAAHGKGMVSTIEHSNSSHIFYAYDDYSRLESKTEGYDIYTCTTSFTYNNNNNQVAQITYPSGFSVTHEYDSYGYLKKVKRTDDGTRIWECTGVNRYGQVTGATLGNGLTITRGYNQYGLPASIQTGSVQNMAFSFNDTTGNLMWRKDNLTGRNFTEYFTYDNLDRLTKNKIGLNNYEVTYQNNGNIAAKYDAGMYGYTGSGPHAVTQLAFSPITGSGQTITYNSFEKPSQITEGSKNLNITYGVDNERIFSSDNSTGSFRERLFMGNYEEETTTTGTRKIHYISGGDGLAAVYIINGSTGMMYYVSKDYLGNILLLTRQNGTVAEEYSFDAWGRRRSPSDWTNYSVSAPAILYRGYTGHEHLDEFGLINMNGRLYDPKLGRFLSPDTYVQAPGYTQSFNRYTYAYNNPLVYTDPDGEWFQWLLGGIIGAIQNVVKNWSDIDGNFIKFNQYAFVGCVAGSTASFLSESGVGAPAVGMVSGWILNTGNAFLKGGNFDEIMTAGVSGSISGGLVGFASMWAGQALSGINVNRNAGNGLVEKYTGKPAKVKVSLENLLFGSNGSQNADIISNQVTSNANIILTSYQINSDGPGYSLAGSNDEIWKNVIKGFTYAYHYGEGSIKQPDGKLTMTELFNFKTANCTKWDCPGDSKGIDWEILYQLEMRDPGKNGTYYVNIGLNPNHWANIGNVELSGQDIIIWSTAKNKMGNWFNLGSIHFNDASMANQIWNKVISNSW